MRPLAITGVGQVSPLGLGLEALREAFADPEAAAKRAFTGEPEVLTREKFPEAHSAEVWGFDPNAHLGDKGHRNFDRLTKYLIVAAKLALAQGELFIVPSKEGGWRTLLLGKPVLTHRELADAKRLQSTIGLPFFQLTFGSSGTASWSAIPRSTPMALVLDGEVITTFLTPNTRSQAQLSLQCSDIWVPPNKQGECAEVVVGRLAAPIPMRVTIITDLKKPE